MTVDRKERARLRRIGTARELEDRGHVDHAVKEYLRAKAPEEAARALAKVGRLADAGAAIVKSLGVDEHGIAPLSAEERGLIVQAISFFSAGHEGAKAQALQEQLDAAPPPEAPSAEAPSAEAPSSGAASSGAPSSAAPSPKKVERASASGRAARPSAVPSGTPQRTAPKSHQSSGSHRSPSAGSGSFRPPSKASASFRPPSKASASFRPPSSASASFRPPVISTVPPEPLEEPAKPSTARHAIPPARKASTPPPTASPASSSSSRSALPNSMKSGSFRNPKFTPAATPQAEAKPKKSSSSPKLSASGEVITEYSGSRASGWRGAGDEALERSIEEHLNAGRKGAAARIARDAGQFGRALAWFEEINLHAQAGACLRALGRPADALAMLLRERSVGPAYRKACFDIIAISVELDTINFDADRFLTRFVADGPADRDEVAAYFDLAQLFVAHKLEGGAKRCLRKVLESDPEHREGKALDEELRRRTRARRPSSSPRVTGMAATARGLPSLPTVKEFVALAREHAPSE